MKGQLKFAISEAEEANLVKASSSVAKRGIEDLAKLGEVDLPEGWEWRRISDPQVAELIMGQSPASDTYNTTGDGLPFYQGKGDFGVINPSPRYWCKVPQRIAQKDDILISVRAPVGPTNISTEKCCIGRGLAAIRAKALADNRFIFFYLRSIETEIAALGQGSTFPSITKSQLADIHVPLPPVGEQRRIVERIETFAHRIEETLNRLNQLDDEFDALCRSIVFELLDGDPTLTPMRELVRLRTPDVVVQRAEIYAFAGLKSFGRGVFKGPVKSGAEFAYPRLTRLRAGEFVYPKLMAWEGAFGVVQPECDGLVVSTEFPVFEVNQEKVLPETLDVYFRTPSVWPMISEISTGTNARRKRLHPSAFLAYEMPLPPMKTQLRLREIKRHVDELRQHHAIQRKELETFLPAVLDRAFRGEL